MGLDDADRFGVVLWTLMSVSIALAVVTNPKTLVFLGPVFLLGWAWFAMRRYRPQLTAPMYLVIAAVDALGGAAALLWLDSTFLAVVNAVLAMLMIWAWFMYRRAPRPDARHTPPATV